MLLLSLVAILIACVCLYLEVADYGPQPYQSSMAGPAVSDHPVAVAGCCGPQMPCARLPVHPVTLVHG
jgi:hypothetical protein